MAAKTPPTALSDADYRALADFRHMLRGFLAFSEARAAEHGLMPRQHQALLAIRAAPPQGAPVGWLAERLLLKPHSATGLMNRLQTLGLVERWTNPQDKRQSLVRLTAQGHKRLAALSEMHREEIRRLRPALDAVLAHWRDAPLA